MYLHTFKDTTLPDPWLLLIGGQVSTVSFTFCQPHSQSRQNCHHWLDTHLSLHLPCDVPCCLLALIFPSHALCSLLLHLLCLGIFFTSLCFPFYFIHFSFCINSPVSFSHFNSIIQISDPLIMINHIYIFFLLRKPLSLSGSSGLAGGYSVLELI